MAVQLTHMTPDPDIALVREALAVPTNYTETFKQAGAALARLEARVAVLERELKQDRKVHYAPTPEENTDFEWKTQEC